ncbi:MAG TPA: SLBB domain-containing protein [Candidatus Saccharimonadales bacterium]|jgi:polysaccharide export outer membrane protein|nr:SLBB domain-containing protein [Candidatus Saccharimonadales bacterium]
MSLTKTGTFHRRRASTGHFCTVLLGLIVIFIFPAISTAQGQQQQLNGIPGSKSDLASQNMNKVAASASDIKAVLLKEPGIMVELKRWVAKDSTDHGQIVGETELSEYAIFDRLENDVEFRSVATILVQRYGYLIPKINPESDLAKEQDLLRIERTKWMAQEDEEERAQARQKAAENLKKTTACENLRTPDCNGAQPNQPPAQQQFPYAAPQNQLIPLENAPRDQTIPNSPNFAGPQLQQTMLMQGGDSFSNSNPFSQLSLSNSTNSNSGNSGSLGGFSTPDSNDIGGNKQLAAILNNQNQSMSTPSDGLLSAYGLGTGAAGDSSFGMGMGMGMDSASQLLGNGGQANALSAPSSPSALMPMQPYRRSPTGIPIQPSDMVRRPNPFEDVPSLADMYMQTVAHPSNPKRFGLEVFENGVHDPQLIPMDLPAGPDYVVGPGDGLTVDLWGSASMRLTRTVDRGGQISLPEVGPVEVNGKTLAAVQEDVQQALRSQYRNVSVGVSLGRLRTIRIYEVGDVTNPGAYDISSLSTPLNALFVAGGPSPRGSLRILKHYRGTQLIQTVDVYDLLLHGVKKNIERLDNGDTVQVPPIGPQVTIEGMVRRPAIYELLDEHNLESVLELAGGLLPTAALRHIEVQRLIAHDKQTMLSLDIPDNSDPKEITKQLESFEIQDGDRIRIYPIAPYNQDTIYLEGHVVRPGRYSYHDSMKVTDVISSYKDLLPEPANQYAEIIRLNAPDFHPSVESFNLSAALADPSKSPALHPMDTIRIFSRFDFESQPTVAVLGDVRDPGTYKTDGEIHLSDAIHMAGGLSNDADTTDAQVFRYQPDGTLKVFSVNLSQAINGSAVENIVLEPRDRLLIHRNTNSIERASVYVQGEVGNPGRYPLTADMRVADLIRIGGGMTRSADTESADLTKYEWLNQAKLSGHQERVSITSALAGDAKANIALHDGDVLTIRQVPGWNDLGASISLRGEVRHPGVYGIRPGERLSSVIERAGGFLPDGYPYGAVLQRSAVREVERKQQNDMIVRAKSVQSNIELMPENDPRQKQAKETALQQYQTTVQELVANPPLGRVSIRISSDISRWKNTLADVEVRAGDSLIIPKKPSYVMVSGQVFNPTAVAYRPGKSAKWYLSQAGGPTLLGDKKAVFVVRADGSVITTGKSMWSGSSMGAVLEPGDTVVVPERPVGGPVDWQIIFAAAQVASAVASTIFIALHY